MDVIARTNVESECVKTENADNKKRTALFLSCSFYGGKWSVEWKEVRLTGTAQRNKANDQSETA